MTIPKEQLKAAHKHCFRNKDEVIASEICGCFNCLKIYHPSEIVIWYEEKSTFDGMPGYTAFCPYCEDDTVIGAKSGYPINHDFLLEMQKRWCATEEQRASGDYEIIACTSFLELCKQWEKANSDD